MLEEIELDHSMMRIDLMIEEWEDLTDPVLYHPESKDEVLNSDGSEDRFSVDLIREHQTPQQLQSNEFMDFVEVNIDRVDSPHWNLFDLLFNLLYVLFAIVTFIFLCILIWCIRHNRDCNNHHDALKNSEHGDIYGSV